jgi:hypothetical protein
MPADQPSAALRIVGVRTLVFRASLVEPVQASFGVVPNLAAIEPDRVQ